MPFKRLAYVIADPCGACKDRGCMEVCPVDCIHEGRVEVEGKTYDQLFIDPEECIFCGVCAPVCPVDAIYPEDELPDDQREFRDVNRMFYERRRGDRGGA